MLQLANGYATFANLTSIKDGDPETEAQAMIAELMRDHETVIATLRADLYDRPLQHPVFGPIVRDATFAVTPMTSTELHDAITLPAERAGVRFEPGLVTTMVGDVVARPGALLDVAAVHRLELECRMLDVEVVGEAVRQLLERRAVLDRLRDDETLSSVPVVVFTGRELSAEEDAILTSVAPLIQERLVVLSEAPDLVSFLFKTADQIVIEDDAKAGLPENTAEVLNAAVAALEPIADGDFKTETVQAALQAALIDGLGLKPRIAFGPLRTGISGRRISPPLFESMEILGKAETIARLTAFASAA